MLSDIRPQVNQTNQYAAMGCAELRPACDDRYSRNPQEDMKEAIDLLFKFKAALDKLHPDCTKHIEAILMVAPRY